MRACSWVGRAVRAAGAAALLAVCVAGGLAGQRGPGTPPDSAAAVDRIFARWNTRETPGCAVGVARAGRVLLERAYGMADLEHDVPNTPGTLFEAGSVSKQFTAAAVVLLAQDGKLSLDDDVRRYIPEVPDYGAPIRIRHLIHHTSGLRDWGVLAGVAGWPRGTRVHTHAHVLDIVARQRALNFEPGSEYLYSNTGYNLLAILVERVTGKPFAEFTKERIFAPLGMARTQWRDDYTRVVKGRALGYSGTPESGFRLDMPFENVHGNGGLLTTVRELLAWNENFVEPRVGGRALVEELERRGRLNDGRTIAYAGGLFIGEHRGVREVSHSGATAGYRAFLARYPDQRLSVALLCNAGAVNPSALGRQVADVFLGDAARRVAAAPRPARVPAERLAALAGTYRNARTHEPLRLVLREGRLRAEPGGELVPLSPALFQIGDGDRRLALEPAGASGARPRLRATGGDGDTAVYEPVPDFAPTPAQLAEYTGEYWSDEVETAFRVEARDGRLVLLRRPDWRAELTPVYPDAFTSRTGLVRFLRDSSGQITGLSLSLGRVRDLRFERLAAGISR